MSQNKMRQLMIKLLLLLGIILTVGSCSLRQSSDRLSPIISPEKLREENSAPFEKAELATKVSWESTDDTTEFVDKEAKRPRGELLTLRVTEADIREAQPIIVKLKYCNALPVKKGVKCLSRLEYKLYELSPRARQVVKWNAVKILFKTSKSSSDKYLCYNKTRGPFATQIDRLIFLIDVISGDLQNAARSFANIGMCYWSHNNFAKAKQYIDQFEHLFSLASHSYHGVLEDSIAHAKPDLFVKKALFWFFGHRFVRFMENTRRTRHRYLCRKGKKTCLDAAWEMMQKVKSASFREAHIASLLANASAKVSELYEERSKLKTKRALLKLLSTDRAMGKATSQKIKALTEQIDVLDFSLYKNFPDLKRPENPSIISLKKFRKKLKANETFISFIMSMECRQPLVWRVDRKSKVQFKRVGKRKACSTGVLVDKIKRLRHKIKRGLSLSQLDSDLKWFREQLFDPIGKLPRVGSKLILSVDEKLAGLPFELIPLKNGRRLGEMYKVSYIPSASMLYELRTSPTLTTFTIPYMGFGRDNHTHLGLNKLNTNKVLSAISKDPRIKMGPDAIVIKEAEEREIYQNHLRMVQAKYIHFMTHTHNQKGFLGLSYGREGTEDGLLTGPEIAAKLSIHADTVLVTACDTAGASERLLPGEAFSSLAVGFVTAGAKRLLITLWPVTDKVAARFSTTYLYYRNNKGKSPHTAMQMARKTLKDKKYPPAAWGGFILMGD